MNWYFVGCIYRKSQPQGFQQGGMEQGGKADEYEEYIRLVKPIVESYGGEYMVRSGSLIALGEAWKPDRMIIIRFPDRGSLDACFESDEYKHIMGKRIASVNSQAVIVPGLVPPGANTTSI